MRAFAMSLGIVLHASMAYWVGLLDAEDFWPADDRQSEFLLWVFEFIHTWRMPAFFILAGFFANLVITRHTIQRFTKDRIQRIALPLAIFGPIMAVLLPSIWVFGKEAVWISPLDIGFPEEWLTHLWFLYYLLILYLLLLIGLGIAAHLQLLKSIGRIIAKAFYTPIPVALVIVGSALLLPRWLGGEDKAVWPINWPDMLYSLVYFLYGYGLYAHRGLIDRFRSRSILIILLTVGVVGFFIHISTQDLGNDDPLWLLKLIGYSMATVGFSLGFIGLFERMMPHPSRQIRWLSDASYWIYIMHMPVVSFFTFYLMRFEWSPELKFVLASLTTALLGTVSYRYLVRYTPLGTMLNGRRMKHATV